MNVKRQKNILVPAGSASGFSLVELCIVMVIIVIMVTMSVPVIQSTLAFYELQGAVSSVSGSIQSTRYRAISDGYPYKVTFSKANNKYQIARCPDWLPTNPGSCAFSDFGSPIPFVSGSSKVVLGSDVSIQFLPSGSVSFLTGGNPINLSRNTGSQTTTKSITVTNYGSIKVK